MSGRIDRILHRYFHSIQATPKADERPSHRCAYPVLLFQGYLGIVRYIIWDSKLGFASTTARINSAIILFRLWQRYEVINKTVTRGNWSHGWSCRRPPPKSVTVLAAAHDTYLVLLD
jgi:hypothetical protein